MSILNFKYKKDDVVEVDSNDHNFKGKRVQIIDRFYAQWSDGRLNTRSYKVAGEGIISSLSFYEDQLKEIS